MIPTLETARLRLRPFAMDDAPAMLDIMGGELPQVELPEIDFLFGREYWGKGYATETARAAIDWGFEVRDFQTIVGIVHVDNQASRRVLQKLGMQLVETAEWFGMPCERYDLQRKYA